MSTQYSAYADILIGIFGTIATFIILALRVILPETAWKWSANYG
jgi:hypothetical protein